MSILTNSWLPLLAINAMAEGGHKMDKGRMEMEGRTPIHAHMPAFDP
jgi:hypothetical protein